MRPPGERRRSQAVRQGSAKAPPPVRVWASPPILVLLLSLLAVAVVGPWLGIRQLDATSSANQRISEARDELDGLVRTQLAEETGLRGYVGTGDRYFLEPDGPPSPTFEAHAENLHGLVAAAEIEGGIALVEDLRATHAQWEKSVAVPLVANPHRSDALLLQTQGKLLTDHIRASSQALRSGLRNVAMNGQAELAGRIFMTVAVSTGLVMLFGLAAVALGRSRERALDRLDREQFVVGVLQQALRVRSVHLPRAQLGFAYASATREALVGGDLIDAWRTGDRGRLLIADVSGKGIEAARHAAFVQYAIRALSAEDDDPGVLIERFNRLFVDTFEDPGSFVVLFHATLEPGTGELRYASAGHGTAFVRRGSVVEQLPPTGTVIGLERGGHFATRSLILNAGDTLLVATDGLTESRDGAGEFLGDEGVATILATGPSEPQALCDVLVAEVQRRSAGTITDDLAIVAVVVADDPGDGSAPIAFSTMEAAAES